MGGDRRRRPRLDVPLRCQPRGPRHLPARRGREADGPRHQRRRDACDRAHARDRLRRHKRQGRPDEEGEERCPGDGPHPHPRVERQDVCAPRRARQRQRVHRGRRHRHPVGEGQGGDGGGHQLAGHRPPRLSGRLPVGKPSPCIGPEQSLGAVCAVHCDPRSSADRRHKRGYGRRLQPAHCHEPDVDPNKLPREPPRSHRGRGVRHRQRAAAQDGGGLAPPRDRRGPRRHRAADDPEPAAARPRLRVGGPPGV
mmetsp:Transcript_13238/g.31340  ORF Transcript_13238/g.31340 Transcript_13238/m.31340 type:complete len:253 (+) Transcript_13238:765-1523(+)